MLIKILLLAVLVSGVLYWILPRRAAPRGPARRGFFIWCWASGLNLGAALLCWLVWMLRATLTRADGRLDFLLPLAGILLLLAFTFGVQAWRRRPR